VIIAGCGAASSALVKSVRTTDAAFGFATDGTPIWEAVLAVLPVAPSTLIWVPVTPSAKASMQPTVEAADVNLLLGLMARSFGN
jgi:hypothetical protein